MGSGNSKIESDSIFLDDKSKNIHLCPYRYKCACDLEMYECVINVDSIDNSDNSDNIDDSDNHIEKNGILPRLIDWFSSKK
jgi:hypothetical protein